MPFEYERKTNRCFRSPPDVLKEATKCVTKEDMSYRKTAANFNVDTMTPMRYAKKKEANPIASKRFLIQSPTSNNAIYFSKS